MTVSNVTTIMVGLGEVKISKDPELVLACLGLGSCVAISVFDPVAKVGGMAHVVLPKSNGKTGERASRYADVAVPLLFERLKEGGAVESRCVVNIAGGAQMSVALGIGTAFKIGEDNIAAIHAALKAKGLKPKAADTGGRKGRTVRLFIETGKTMVSSAGNESREL